MWSLMWTRSLGTTMDRYTDCYTPDFGYTNPDGYVRVLNKPRPQGGLLKMRHRLYWEDAYGKIPDGYEINHLCKNRACCNIEHLECLLVSEHRAKDNALRYKDRADKVVEYVLDNPDMYQREVADVFGISQAGVCVIMKRYRKGK